MRFRATTDTNPWSISSRGCTCWEIGVDLVEDSTRLCLYWGVCRWKQLINCSEMELCKSSLVNPSDHLCSGFQQLHKTLVVSEDLTVLSWHQPKLQSQILFFWAFRFIWSQSKTREVEVNGNCHVKGKFMTGCAVRSWLHFAVTGSRLA